MHYVHTADTDGAIMFELTERQCLELSNPEPVAVNPATKQSYVLVPQGRYDRFKSLFATEDYDPDEGAMLINEVMADDDAKDPLLSSYQHYGQST